MPKKLLTLCIIHTGTKVLLGMKKRGFGQGKWNGFGGKVELDETFEEAAWREVQEECGLHVDVTPKDKVAILTFLYPAETSLCEVHVYKITAFRGEVRETDEMLPSWFFDSEIPYSEMWASDIFWLPLLLQGKKFIGTVSFDSQNRITEKSFEEREVLEQID